MFKVLIVDDEPFVRKGLALLIKWEEFGFAICGEAENGKKAVTEIKRLKPDVVITDVRMPDLDGLELIKYHVEDLKSNVRFIILSGYDDFKYAQKAIKYGVKQYILKPIEQEELIGVLKGIYNELTEEIKKQVDYNNEISRYTRAIATDTINMLLKGDKSAETLERAKKIFGFDARDKFRYVLIRVLNEIEKAGTCRIQCKILEKSLEPEFLNSIFRVSEDSYGILLYSKILKNQSLKQLVDGIYKNISKGEEADILVLIGKEIEDISFLNVSYDSLQLIEDYRFYNNGKIIYYDTIENISFKTVLERSLFDTELLEAMETGQYTKIRYVIKDIQEYAVSQLIEPAVLKSLLSDFKYKVLSIISQMNGSQIKINEFYSNLGFDWTKSDITDFTTHVLSFCLFCSEYMNELQRHQSKGILQQVEEYLKSNYSDESLNLKKTAQHFYINSLYLGQLFKQAYNIRFNDYMHKLRIEGAKTLLRRTNLKIYEISERVGYKDADYFASKFESIEKTTPTQYRKNLLL